MNNQLAQQQNTPLSIKGIFTAESTKKRFEELLGKKASGFISSVLQISNNNTLLANADPKTILNAAVTAAALDLPINQNLGFSWIVPYKGQAQFQMGWKGYVQLALRTGQYTNINVIEVYQNQFKSFNTLTEELDADFSKEAEGEPIGYVCYFKLINGFSKTVYWSKEKVIKHASKYSQTFGKMTKYNKPIHSPWNDPDQFPEMAKKTVLKNTISKWGIMSIEMQTAQLADQAVQVEENNFKYVDNETIDITEDNEEVNRTINFIKSIENKSDLDALKNSLDEDLLKSVSKEIEEKENELLFNEATQE